MNRLLKNCPLPIWIVLAICLMSIKNVYAQVEDFQSEWLNTDFETRTVDLEEIFSGGVPKDGILAILEPEFIPIDEADLLPNEGVMTLELDGQIPRTYPIRYLLWHEIVNDTIADTPVAVTFCPLCNSGVFFDRRLQGETLTFGVSGKLRNSDMIMYDHNSESWWQQATGEAIVGLYSGSELISLPGWTESWKEFMERNEGQGGLVMAEPQFNRRYGQNPYVGYELSAMPFLYQGEFSLPNIMPLARVVRVGNQAWPLERIILEGGLVQEFGLTITWTSGQVSALDTQSVGEGINVGSIRVRDTNTGKDVPHDLMFAFVFGAFFPEGQLMFMPQSEQS